MKEELQAMAREIEKRLADQGRAIEGGWRSYKVLVLPKGVSRIQEDETQQAFYAGANHALFTLLSIMDPGEDPTEADLQRLSKMTQELQAFNSEFCVKHGLPLPEGAADR